MNSKLRILIGSLILFLILFGILLYYDGFDLLYELSREHEDWELDELVTAIFVAAIVTSIVASLSTYQNLRRLKAEMALREQYQSEAIATRHLQSLGTLAGGLAHSANNHLQPIVTLARLSRNEVPQTSEVYDHLGRILQSAEATTQLFKNILSFSNSEAGAAPAGDIEACFEQLVPLLEVSLGRNIALEMDISTDGPLPMDAISFSDIILTLVDNAGHAVGAKGRVTISAARSTTEELLIHVIDDGIGMSKEEINRAFDPFYTSKPGNQGTGLGLSIVRSLVERSNGHIHIDSTPGVGTTIQIVFPAVRATQQLGS